MRWLAALLLGWLAADAAADDARARMHYLLHCGGCHLPDGRGVPPDVPSLRGDPGRLAAYPDGRRYLARIPGASQAPLSDAELTAVLNWVLSAFNRHTLPAGHEPLTVDEVASARQDPLPDPARARQAIWERHGLR